MRDRNRASTCRRWQREEATDRGKVSSWCRADEGPSAGREWCDRATSRKLEGRELVTPNAKVQTHSMPCLLGCLALSMPRLVLFLVWLFTGYLDSVYTTKFWLLLGFLFMPLT